MKPLIATIIVFATCIFASAQTPIFVFYYPKGQTTLTLEQKLMLEQKLDSLALPSFCKISITGYTDSEGKKKNNLFLSQKRAQETKDYLVSRGFDSLYIEALGAGQIEDKNMDSSETARRRNRKVVVRFSCPVISGIAIDTTLQPKGKFENDTIIYGKQGTQVLIKEKSFYPRKIKDVEIKINEIFSMCDSIPEELQTVTETGICLASGGMAFVQAEYKKKPIRASVGAKFEVRIPVLNNDTSFRFYIAVQKNGTIKWRERKGTKQLENGQLYYVFETNVLGGFNCDAPIPGCNVNSENSYKIKTWTRYSTVRFYVDGQFSFFTAPAAPGSAKKYTIVNTASPENIYVYAEGGKNFLLPFHTLHGFVTKDVYKLSDLKYNKRKNMYKLSRSKFKSGSFPQLRSQRKQKMKCK
jgi:hypothetical protein